MGASWDQEIFGNLRSKITVPRHCRIGSFSGGFGAPVWAHFRPYFDHGCYKHVCVLILICILQGFWNATAQDQRRLGGPESDQFLGPQGVVAPSGSQGPNDAQPGIKREWCKSYWSWNFTLHKRGRDFLAFFLWVFGWLSLGFRWPDGMGLV